MPKLIVQLGGQEWTVDLKEGPNVVGRQSTCTIPLKEPSLSRQHCELVVEGSRVTLVDKGSMNGTLVNGKKVASQVLGPGDKISLGQAVLWLETKNVAVETRTPPPPPRPAPADPSASSNVATRRSLQAVSPPVSDYVVRVRSGGAWGKIVAVVAVAAALAVGAVLARDFFKSGGPVVVEDPGNLLAKTAGFDRQAGGRPDGWALREKGATVLAVDPAQGRGGGPCMLVEKAPSDLVAEIGWQEDFTLGATSAVDVEVQTRFETFTGWAAIKVDWLRGAKGPVLAEECSDAATRCAQWTALTHTFAPPVGATAFRLSLVVIGRGGRIFFDDAAARKRAGPGASPEHKIGSHGVRATRQGVLQIAFQGRQALTNVGLRLESEKEGGIPQATAFQVTMSPQQDVLVFNGKMLNPVDFRELEVEQQVAAIDGATEVSWRFKGPELRQVDRVTVQVGLPAVDGILGLPESPEQPVSRLLLGSSEGDFVLETREPARVKELQVQGRRRLLLSFRVDPQQEEPAFGFSVRTASAGAAADPEKASRDAEAGRRFGEAISILKGYLSKIKDAGVREKVEVRIKGLQESERREWAEVQGLASQAELSRRAEILKRAEEAVEAYAAQWKGAGVEGKAELVRERLRALGGEAAAAEEARPRKILDHAKKLAEGGKRATAEAMLRALLAKYPTSEVSTEARQLLGTLGQ